MKNKRGIIIISLILLIILIAVIFFSFHNSEDKSVITGNVIKLTFRDLFGNSLTLEMANDQTADLDYAKSVEGRPIFFNWESCLKIHSKAYCEGLYSLAIAISSSANSVEKSSTGDYLMFNWGDCLKRHSKAYCEALYNAAIAISSSIESAEKSATVSKGITRYYFPLSAGVYTPGSLFITFPIDKQISEQQASELGIKEKILAFEESDGFYSDDGRYVTFFANKESFNSLNIDLDLKYADCTIDIVSTTSYTYANGDKCTRTTYTYSGASGDAYCLASSGNLYATGVQHITSWACPIGVPEPDV